ncbi:MAG: HypC/HybG/HupF family hydrogenase formation chaperone [bacterium]|nr:HypC/HybG/HupF family hydrogenase formation chaperone [bacterium]
MCLAVPGKILEIVDSGEPVIGRTAMVDFQGSRLEASLAMVPEAEVDDWVLVHAGFAMSVLDEKEAKENWDMLKAALGDDVELVGNEPTPKGDEDDQ